MTSFHRAPVRSMTSTRDFYDTAYHFGADADAPNLPRIRRALRHLGPLDEQRVLDVGCGVGWAGEVLDELGAESVVGVDFSRRALSLAATRRRGVWLQADGCRLPVRHAAVDCAVSFGSLEHFPDVPAAFGEISRVLRPGGRAVVVVPNFFARTEQPEELRSSYFGWRRMIRDAGLLVVKTRADRGPPVLSDRRPLRSLLRLGGKILSCIPGLQYQFVFVLERPGTGVVSSTEGGGQ